MRIEKKYSYQFSETSKGENIFPRRGGYSIYTLGIRYYLVSRKLLAKKVSRPTKQILGLEESSIDHMGPKASLYEFDSQL